MKLAQRACMILMEKLSINGKCGRRTVVASSLILLRRVSQNSHNTPTWITLLDSVCVFVVERICRFRTERITWELAGVCRRHWALLLSQCAIGIWDVFCSILCPQCNLCFMKNSFQHRFSCRNMRSTLMILQETHASETCTESMYDTDGEVEH